MLVASLHNKPTNVHSRSGTRCNSWTPLSESLPLCVAPLEAIGALALREGHRRKSCHICRSSAGYKGGAPNDTCPTGAVKAGDQNETDWTD